MQLCYLRHPGFALPSEAEPPASLLNIVGSQLYIEPDIWPQYAQRPETRREHLLELQAWLNLTPFAAADYRHLVQQLAELAKQTDRGIVLAEAFVDLLRQQCIILPALDVIDRVCSEAFPPGFSPAFAQGVCAGSFLAQPDTVPSAAGDPPRGFHLGSQGAQQGWLGPWRPHWRGRFDHGGQRGAQNHRAPGHG